MDAIVADCRIATKPVYYCEEMSGEEKPPEQISPDCTVNSTEDHQDLDSVPVEAEFAESEIVDAVVKAPREKLDLTPRLAPSLKTSRFNAVSLPRH